jgi:hypothetical protein
MSHSSTGRPSLLRLRVRKYDVSNLRLKGCIDVDFDWLPWHEKKNRRYSETGQVEKLKK